MQILHLYFLLHVGVRAKGFGYLMCSGAKVELPKGYSPPLPTSCTGALVLASPIRMSSGMLRAVREQGRMLPSHTDHPSTGALPLLPQGRGAADLHQELTGTAQLPSLGRVAREGAAGFGARRAPRGGRAASLEVNNASLVP